MFVPRVIKAVRIKDADSLEFLKEYTVKYFLLDTYTQDRYGGTGQTFDWSLAIKAKEYGHVILSGGLTPENISDAIRTVAPYGVDVSSGVEKSPGKKDRLKIKQLMEAIHFEEKNICEAL
jgi:phosphoribosylanthranilate isomerase